MAEHLPGYPLTTASDTDGFGPDDITTAVQERLAAWMRDLRFNRSITGDEFQFANVETEWPDDDDELETFPVASIIEASDTQYGGEMLTPYPLFEEMQEGDEYGIQGFKTGDATVSLQVDIWCRNKVERKDIRRYFEQNHSPGSGTRSLVLEMPRYYNQKMRAVFSRSRSWLDEDTSQLAEYRLTYWLDISAPLIKIEILPAADVHADPESDVITGSI